MRFWRAGAGERAGQSPTVKLSGVAPPGLYVGWPALPLRVFAPPRLNRPQLIPRKPPPILKEYLQTTLLPLDNISRKC